MFTRIIDFLDKFLVCFPYILIIASTIVFIYSFFSGLLNRYFTEVVIILGSAFIASIFLIYTRKNQGDDNILCSHLFSFQQKRLTVIFLITASLLLIANLQANGRPFYLLILLGSLYIIIILQIFSNGCKPGIVLLELVAATAFLIVPQFFSPAFYYGCGDVLPHTKWVNLIIETGSISELLGEYSSYFTYHVLSAMLGQTGNIADNTAVYAVSAVAFMTSVLFVFYLFKGMSKNTWISLLGAFLYITANVLLLNFLKPAPRIMASVAFVILLYLIFKRWNTVTIPSILGGIVSVYLVLTHHAQAPVFLFVLGLLCMGNILYQNRLFVGNKIVYILYLVSLIAYFIYTYLAFILSWVEHHVISYIESWSVQEISMVCCTRIRCPHYFSSRELSERIHNCSWLDGPISVSCCYPKNIYPENITSFFISWFSFYNWNA